MNDQEKAGEQLLAELEDLRQQVANQEAQLARSRQAESALGEDAERFRRVVEDGPLGIVLVDLEARIEHVNRRFCKMLEYSEREIIELGLRAITHPDDWDPDRNLGVRLRHGEIPTYTIDKRYLRKDGQVIWGQLTASLLHDAEGRPTHIIGMVEDITVRKQSEQALLESERRLNRLMANLPGAVYRCQADRDWTVEFLSEGYLPLTGYDPSQLIGRPGTLHADLIHVDDRQRELDVMLRAIAEKRPYQVEYRLRTATGEEKWVWEQGTGVFSDSGELEAIEGFTTDVTALKRAEAELQEAHDRLDQRVRERTAELTEANARLQVEVEQRRQAEEELAIFRRFAEAATQGFGMVDVQGNFLYVNPFLARLFGRPTPEEVIGKPIANFYPREYLDRRDREIVPALRRKENWHGEQMMVFPDGRLHYTMHTVFPVLDEHGDLFCGAAVITDITERRQAEEQLAIWGRFVDAATQGFGMCDVDRRITYLNPMMARMLGEQQPADALGQDISTYHTRDYARIRDKEIRPALSRNGAWQGELTIVRRDGTLLPTLHNIFPVRDRDGNVSHFAVVVTDISEIKQAEAELKAEQRALRRMVLASDHERRLITYELHDGVAQQLVGAMMHFRSQRLPAGRRSKATGDAYRDGMEALRQASLELRRMMSWLRTPALEKLGVAAAIEDVASQLRLLPEAPKIEYRHAVEFTRLEPTLENSLFRVAQEALTNACRYSKSEKVRVTLTQKGGEVALEVRDWGIGFDQAAVTENRFGLEGIRERSRLLGGKLTIKSKPGQGTVVRVKFPVIEARSPPS